MSRKRKRLFGIKIKVDTTELDSLLERVSTLKAAGVKFPEDCAKLVKVRTVRAEYCDDETSKRGSVEMLCKDYDNSKWSISREFANGSIDLLSWKKARKIIKRGFLIGREGLNGNVLGFANKGVCRYSGPFFHDYIVTKEDRSARWFVVE